MMYSTIIETIKSLPAFDVFVILFLLYCIFMGGKRGMFLQITSIASLLAGWYVSSRYSAHFVSYFPLGDTLSGKASSVVTFFAVMIGITILGRVLSGMFIAGVLKEVNRQLGALFGLIKGVVVCLVITYFAVTLSNATKNFVIGSQSGKMMVQILCEAQTIIPDNPQTVKVRSALDDFKKAAADNNAVKSTSSTYQISTFKNDIANSFYKAKEKSASLKKSVQELNSLTSSLTGLKNKFSGDGSSHEIGGNADTYGAAQTTPIVENRSVPQAPPSIPTPPDVPQPDSQDDVLQTADAIFSRNLFRSVSPVDQTDRQPHSVGSNDIYGSGDDTRSSRYYTPSY